MSVTDTDLALAADSTPRDWWQLLKPRVMSLVVFTALVGLIAAPEGVHPVLALASVLCIAVGAGASGALNQWYDADIDERMKRTRSRPVPGGRVSPQEALAFGLGLSGFSVVMLALFANWVAAGLLAFTIFFYAVIYTMWLKRWTAQNIVIGGAAGAFPPMIGWAVATGGISPESVLMFTVILLWTPPHFWALALFTQDDYARAEVPMLPLVAGERQTRWQIFGYAVALALSATALAFTSVGGVATLAVGLAVNALFLRHCWRLLGRGAGEAQADRYGAEKKAFGVSILYLFALFGAVAADALLPMPAFWPMLF
jgi:protoheme IX farnesyltransferase